MSHSQFTAVFHVVFSTGKRRPVLKTPIRSELFLYLGQLALELDIRLIESGGSEDHVHLLIDVPAIRAPAACIQKLKSNSSRWLKQRFVSLRYFSWQTGYYGCSVCPHHTGHLVRYIQRQEDHHLNHGFLHELRKFLQNTRVVTNPPHSRHDDFEG